MTQISDVDIIALLGLEEKLSPGEIDEMLDTLSKEIWFRVLNESLPLYLDKDELEKLTKATIDKGLDETLSYIKENLPRINIQFMFLETTQVVKKEFVVEYIKDWRNGFQNKKYSEEFKENARLIFVNCLNQTLKLVEKNQWEKDKIEKLIKEAIRQEYVMKK
ncbi:hypothetical protein COY89_01435 [Candidatus Roizmanbacteria bacterium CG_4_10_14_0_8_um_filter_36_36]|nr:MAG: hypothetical protein COY89_01435 [Candidatus Roizmanbacteria bacterium CG_4_10_14_0_8_um_filter_36_36]